MVCNPFCCTSIRKGAKNLAIIDIILFFLTLLVSVGLEWSLFNSIPMRLVLFDDGVSSAEMYEEIPQNEEVPLGKAVWIHIAEAIKWTSENNVGLGYLFYMSLLMGMMGYFILEIWLCCVLIRAATERRVEFCTKWLWWRGSLLLVTLTVTGIHLIQFQYTVTDIILQPLNVLRLFSLLAVVQLRKKLRRMEPKLMY